MALKIRMTRMGRRHRPFFRINAIESRAPRDGQFVENLGYYDPIEKDPAKQLVLDKERAQYWLDKGAEPSDTVGQILLKQGIKTKYTKEKTARIAKARTIARKKGRPFTKAEKLALQKQAAPAGNTEAGSAEKK
jgi:small subunit ribosomal protein S16